MARWFYVIKYDYRAGKEEELQDWIVKKGEPYWRSLPEVRSVKTYMRCIGLGQRPIFQTFLEIPNLACLDNFRKDPSTLEGGPEFFRLIENFSSSIIREVTESTCSST